MAKRRVLLYSIAISIGFALSSATADLTIQPIGGPEPSGSWSQSWAYDGTGASFFGGDVMTDLVAFEVLADSGSFELGGTPANSPLYGFSDPTWHVNSVSFGHGGDAYLVSAAGDAALQLGLSTHFAGDASDGIMLRIAAWDAADQNLGALPFDVVHALFDGTDWTVQAGTWNIVRGDAQIATLVPVPPAALLGGMGLMLVAGVKRRLR